jgi:hypothetical protein
VHPLLRTALRRGARLGVQHTLRGTGPRSGAVLATGRPVPDEVRSGERAPRPDELLGTTARGVGRFADIDPLLALSWQRQQGRVATLLGWAAVAAAVGRRRWRSGA